MTILIGYIPTPVGEAALDAGLAEAAARGEDVVILNSPRRGATVDVDLVDDDSEAEPGRPRRGARRHARGSTTPTTAPTSWTTFAALVPTTGARLIVIGLRRRQPGRQAGARQRRAADPARVHRAGARGQARPMSRTGSRGSSSPRSRSRDPPLLNVVGVHQPWALRAIVEVHTDSGLLGLGETYADETHLARLRRRRRRRCPATTPTTCTGCGGWSSACSARRRRRRRHLRRDARRRLGASTPSTRPSRSRAWTSRAARPAGR